MLCKSSQPGFNAWAGGLLVLAFFLSACSSPRKAPPPARVMVVSPAKASTVPHRKSPAAANEVLVRALGLIGTPYRYGGNTPESGFDCSGLVNYVFRDVLDLKLPRTSRELAAHQGPRIEKTRLTNADLVFFSSNGKVNHVGIYIGDGRFVHAPSNGGTVRIDRLDGHYWKSRYSGARRVL